MRGAVLLAMVLVPLAGCLSGDDSGPATVTETGPAVTSPPLPANLTPVSLAVELTGFYPANPDFAPDPLSVPAGSRVTLTFRNTDLNPLGKHDWTLDGVEGARTEVIAVGEEQAIVFDAPAPGTYTFYCSVPGHRTMGVDGGMQGELVVE